MKHFILILIFFSVTSNLLSQTYKVTYKEKMVLSEKTKKQIEHYPDVIKANILKKQKGEDKILLLDKLGNSMYTDATKLPTQLGNTNEKSGNTTIKRQYFKSKNIYYKNNKELVIVKAIAGEDYFIKDNLNSYKWKLTNEVKKVGKFECKKAVTTIDGINIEAWYTEQIAVNNGPAQYGGLPGLIVYLSTDNKSFELLKIEKNNSNKAKINIPKAKNTMTMKEFKSKFNSKNNVRKTIRTTRESM